MHHIKDLEAFAETHGFELSEDNYGQIILYTDRIVESDGSLSAFDPDDLDLG